MMKTAIVAVLMIASLASPWVKEPVETEPEPEVIATVSTEAEQVADDGCWEYSATMTVTHYCNCARCCGKWAGGPTASGVMPEAGRTVAVDKSVIPLGSEVKIGDTVYIAEDTGVKGYSIDIFCNSHSEALERGMYRTEVCWR